MKSTFPTCRSNYVWLAMFACVMSANPALVWPDDLPVFTSDEVLPKVDNVLSNDSFIPNENPIGAIILSKRHPLLLRADFSRVAESVLQIYRANNFQAIWFNESRSEKNLSDLLEILRNASSDGLKPAQYEIDRLSSFINEQQLDRDTRANYDVALTVSLVRFLNELRQGRVEPRDVDYPVHIPQKPPLDIAGSLAKHMASETLKELVAEFEPKAKQYQQLKHILNRLQALGNADATGATDFKPSRSLRPGEKHPDIIKLRERLRVLGKGVDDMGLSDNSVYDTSLVAAIKSLQREHGLKPDGVIGPATAALFSINASEKIEQIELAMERARWIPDTADGPLIVVNIPAFELWAFNSSDDQNPLNMKVVVGKAPDNQTPLLWEEMKYLEFMPYWNIPKTIFQKEILPKVANNEGYLASQEIELIRHYNREDQGGGSYIRARQRPGKKNPLGRVKFVFPNTADVYLHDTPSRAAFNRPRRDLSHGCVRVSEPERLAEFVLGDQQGWDRETIRQAMSAPKTRHVTLKRSVPVLFYYGTTFVDHENKLRFYPDVYGQDEQLKRALEKVQSPGVAGIGGNQQLVSKATELVMTH